MCCDSPHSPNLASYEAHIRPISARVGVESLRQTPKNVSEIVSEMKEAPTVSTSVIASESV